MILGHGDDAWRFERPIQANFSSNVYSRVDLTALKAHLAARLDAIGHYPEPEPYALERALAVRLGLDPASVCVTNGATEAIYLTAHAFAGSQTTILQPTFSEYADACMLYSHRLIPCATPPGPRTCQLFWLCNPNNPTGDVIPKEELVKTIEAYPETIFVIDQSYGYFTKEPLLSAAEAVTFPNVIQLHSMTKRYAMPGIRLGYITANPQLVERIRAVRMPWSVNAMAIEAGKFLLEKGQPAVTDLDAYLREEERLRAALRQISGIRVFETKTNYMLCMAHDVTAKELKEHLLQEHGILIRDCQNFYGLSNQFFRITTQLPEENDALVQAVRQFMENL